MKSNKKKILIKRFIITLILFMSNFLGATVFADDNIKLNEFYISENNYESDMKNKVEPYIKSLEQSGTIKGQEYKELYYKKFILKDSKGSVVISHGFTEYIERYNEMIYYFLNEGYNVFIMEHRGHGRSGTLGKEDITQIDVENFDYYILDFKKFIDEIVLPENNNNKLFLFAHSMGGGIGAKFIEDYPEYFDAAILSSPMLEIHTGEYQSGIAKIIANIAYNFGFGDKYVFGEEKFNSAYGLDGSGTSSKNRYDYNYNILMGNEQLQRGGASFRWLYNSFKATNKIIDKENASKVKIPVLLFQSENDTYVKPKGQNQFAKYAQNCELISVAGAKHEIYREKDEIQKPYLEKVIDFYNKNI